MKKRIALVLACLMALSMAACGGKQAAPAPAAPAATEAAKEEAPAPAADAQKLIYVHGASDTSILQVTAQKFKELVEEKTEGRYTIEIHGGFELGNMTESIEMIKTGDVAASGVCLSSSYSPDLAFLDLPNIVPSIEQAYELYSNEEVRAMMGDVLRAENIELLAVGPVYFRETSSNKEIHTLADFEGLQIRTQEISLQMDFWKSLGATPTPIAWAEVYTALQQGMVDAEENPYDSIWGSNLFEVQKYLINSHHIIYTAPILLNEDFFAGLSADDQEIFKACAKDAEAYAFQYARDYESDLRSKLEEKGMTVIDLEPEVLVQMKEKAAGVYDTVRGQIGDEKMDVIEKAIAEVTK